MAGRHRRQGQRRRCCLREADQGRHRLRRTVLRAAEQAVVHRDEECRRPLRAAERRLVRRRRCQRRLGQRQGLLPGDDQRPGRRVLADHRHQLHPGAQEAEERCQRQGHPGVLPLGLQERRRPGPPAGLRAAAGQPGPPDRDLLVAEPEVSKRVPPQERDRRVLSPPPIPPGREILEISRSSCFRGCTCHCSAEPMLGCALERADQRSAPTEGREQSSMARLYKSQPAAIPVRRSGFF
ncbi:hypothetical protein SMJ63A_140107 [Stenotrophomonas geniculata]